MSHITLDMPEEKLPIDLATRSLLIVDQVMDQTGLQELQEEGQEQDTTRPTAKTESLPYPNVNEGHGNRAQPDELPSQSERTNYPKPWCDGPRVYMERSGSDSWATLQKLVEKYDREMCEGWKDDLDTMLVFTGLFSAVVTAFCVESFNSLSQAPADTTNALLYIISQQLSNSSVPAAISASVADNFVATKSDVQINVLYFVSLALALSVSSICILAKQWIREFSRDVAVSAHDALRVRQARYDGLMAWKVPQILAALPVILQAALLLFFAGLLAQLWNVDDFTTAIAVTLVVILLLLAVVYTTVVPSQRKSHANAYERFTPFRSPQAWIFLVAWQRIRLSAIDTWHSISKAFLPGSSAAHKRIATVLLSSWAHFDTKFIADENYFAGELALWRIPDNSPGSPGYTVTSSHRVLRWVYEVLRSVHQVEESLLWCINEPVQGAEPPTMAHYVNEQTGPVPVTSELICYELSCKMRGMERLDRPHGRSQVEMLIRGGNQATVALVRGGDAQTSWSSIFLGLCFHHDIFDCYTESETCRYQDIITIQIALFLKNLFDAWIKVPVSSSPHWNLILRLFLDVKSHGESKKSQSIIDLTEDVLTNGFPQTFYRSRSVVILTHVARATHYQVRNRSHQWPLVLRMFTSLDAIMVHWCLHPQETEDISPKLLEQWRELRTKLEEISDNFDNSLPEDHFDIVNGSLPTSKELEELLASSKGLDTTIPASGVASEV